MDPSLEMRWFDDPACLSYMQEHFGKRMASRLENEPRGSFRGDLCRAAVLFSEGGFYVDIDVQPRVPLTRLVDNDTTFMAAFTIDGAVLNALVAAEPRNTVIAETLRELRRWYDGDAPHTADEESEKTTNEWMGPVTMLRGLRNVMKKDCPDIYLDSMRQEPKWSCGDQRFRFYDEKDLDCGDGMFEPKEDDPNSECPPARARAEFPGARFGIFVPSTRGKRELVAWPRFESCEDWGCKSGGWEERKAAEDDSEAAAAPKEDSEPGKSPKDL